MATPTTALSTCSSISSLEDTVVDQQVTCKTTGMARTSTTTLQRDEIKTVRSAKEVVYELLYQIEAVELRRSMKSEIKRMLKDHDRLVTMLQQRSLMLESENDDLKAVSHEHQRRYEKAVREMQFFRRKYDRAVELHKQQQQQQQQHQHQQLIRPRSLSIDSDASSGYEHPSTSPHPFQQKHHHQQGYPLTPTSPQPSSIPTLIPIEPSTAVHEPIVTDLPPPPTPRTKSTMPSRSSSTSTNSSSSQYWSGAPIPGPPTEPAPPVPRLRQNSITTSVNSAQSSSTDGQSTSMAQPSQKQPPSSAASTTSATSDGNPRRKKSWQSNQQPSQALPHSGSTTSTVASASTAPATTISISGTQQQTSSKIANNNTENNNTANNNTNNNTANNNGQSNNTINSNNNNNNNNTPNSVPMTPVRSSTATNGYTGASLIQQRRVDPLIFGGSDGLWETIGKSKGSDVTVEKIISNFLRRGGSPNTAKQSPSANAVKYGYGMIHALIVTKAPGSLDLLLQQGANPNVMTLSQIEDDKVTPCYLAASVGWLTGLQKLVQAGGDLMAARGAGVKNKTVLHVAAEHCHAAVVEYIVNVTQGGLNLEEDSHGATVLHYACASGHTDLVSFLARSCQIPVNQADHRGELPLHWAARHGRLEVVTLLVERCGCDFNAYVPRKVGTPLDLAKASSHRRLVDYLKGLGASTAKKMDKRREEELAKEVPTHLESTLTRNGLYFFGEEPSTASGL